jgi:dihydropteroate synthase
VTEAKGFTQDTQVMGIQVMGIVNVTSDSFSGDGHGEATSQAIAHGAALFDSGCSIADVGAVSTRPGADDVPLRLELARVLPVVHALSQLGEVSIDTTNPEVARQAIAAGATWLNDVSGELGALAGELGACYVGMHRRGTPKTMQSMTDYDDVVLQVTEAMLVSCRRAKAAGAKEVVGDPGIGFSKTFAQNRVLLKATRQMADCLGSEGFGLLIGVSRKGFLSEGLGQRRYAVGERLEQSVAAAVWAMVNGAKILRVHDGPETVYAAKVVSEQGDSNAGKMGSGHRSETLHLDFSRATGHQ